MLFKKIPDVFFVMLKTSLPNPYPFAGVWRKRCCPSVVGHDRLPLPSFGKAGAA